MKLLVWMQDMAARLGVIPGRGPTGRWMVRFSAAILASLALWGLFLLGLSLIIDWTGLF